MQLFLKTFNPLYDFKALVLVFYNFNCSLEQQIRIIMQSGTQRHSSIHTMTIFAHKSTIPDDTNKKLSRPSTFIMNELADVRNQIYLSHLQQYYEQLQKIMQNNSHKRIKSDPIEFIVFIVNQLILSSLTYKIIKDFGQSNVTLYIQIFSIISLFSGIYFISLHILNFGLSKFLEVSCCLDKLMLILISICLANAYVIGILGFSSIQSSSLKFFIPFWLFHSAATVRIQVMNYKWAKFEIIISKMVHLVSFVLILVQAWQFVYNQKYKQIASNFNSYQIMLIYCVAIALYFVEFYRLITKFDGTNDLRYEYQFQDNGQVAIRKKKKELQQKLQLWKINK